MNKMKNLEPTIYRQRLVIEGKYDKNITPITPNFLKEYMKQLSEKAKMTIIYGPLIKNLAAQINPIHAGYECLMIWAESGVQLYTWNKQEFFTIDIYTCKKMDSKEIIEFTKNYFKTKKITYKNV